MARKLISSGSTFERDIGYSRAVVDGDWVFVSGTTGFDYGSMTISPDVAEQTERCLRNIEAALAEAECSLRDVVRVTYVLPKADEFPQCWPILRRYFGEIRPAAMMISAGLADPRMRIEIEVTARRPSGVRNAAVSKETTIMADNAKHTTATVIPTLRYRDATAAIEWLGKAFGFEKHLVVPGENGTIAHAQLVFGNGMIMLSSARDDEFGRLQQPPSNAGSVVSSSPYVIVNDVDAHHARAVEAGATVVMPLKDEDYGGRGYSCSDPEGYLWNFGSYDPWHTA